MSECLTPTNCKAKSLVAKCGSVSEKFVYLMQTKELIRNTLIEKGIDVPANLPFRDYVEKMASLVNQSDVVTSIIDYQGGSHKGDVTVDKTFIGLDQVDNTSDLNKPVSTATQEALDKKQDAYSDDLETTAKTIVGAINELKAAIDGQTPSFLTYEGKVKLPALSTEVLPVLGNAYELYFEAGTLQDVNLILIVTDNSNIINKFSFSFTMGMLGENKLISERILETLISFGDKVNLNISVSPDSTENNYLLVTVENLDNRPYNILCSTVIQKKPSNW